MLRTDNSNTGYSGDYSIAWTLDPTALASLAVDGIIEYGISGTGVGYSDVVVKDATLTVEVVPATAVPEPMSLALVGATFVGLAGLGRRQRRSLVAVTGRTTATAEQGHGEASHP